MKFIKQNKILITIGLFILILIIFYFHYEFILPQKVENTTTVQNVERLKIQNKIEEVKKENINVDEENNNNTVLLTVLDKSYKVNINGGENVYEVMKKLENEKDSNFYFKYKEYPSLGIFVKEINGVSDGEGRYWFYHVNDIEASVGISNYVIKKGDIISWKLK